MLKLQDIELSYGRTKVLNKLNMEVVEREIFGLVGPENAGKSLVCKIALGLLLPDKGSVTMLGKSIDKDETIRKSIGYLPEQLKISEYQLVEEYLIFFGKLYGISTSESDKRAKEIVKFTGLEGKEQVSVNRLSRGEQIKLGIGRALMHQPKLIILDEVFSGLDPIFCREIQTLILRMKQMGLSILITANHLENVSKLCDRIAIMDEGVVIASGTTDDIQYLKLRANPIIIRVESSVEEVVNLLRLDPNVKTLSRKDNILSIRYHGMIGQETELLTRLIQNEVKVSAFYREESDFESLYFKITSK